MRQLLDRGADIDAKTEDGDTPLSLAVSAGAVSAVGFLVKAGASLESIDQVCRGSIDSQVTPLQSLLVIRTDIYMICFQEYSYGAPEAWVETYRGEFAERV